MTKNMKKFPGCKELILSTVVALYIRPRYTGSNSVNLNQISEEARGVVSLKFKVRTCEQADCMQKRNIYKQCRPRWDAAKCVSSGFALLPRYTIKIVYDQALIDFALIGDKLSKGTHEEAITIIITNSHKIGFREINIDSTHTFCTHNIKDPSELW